MLVSFIQISAGTAPALPKLETFALQVASFGLLSDST